DLLLGTQGWRRFAFQDAEKFLAAHHEAAERVLAIRKTIELPASAREGERFKAGGPDLAPRPTAAPRAVVARADKADQKKQLAPRGKVPEAPPAIGGRAAVPRMPMKDRRAMDERAGEEAQDISYIAVVREYAHKAATSLEGGRTDFQETLYWNAGLSTNERGEATFSFDLADSVTTFRIRADAVSKDGALGAGDAMVESRRPFYVEPKLPLEVSAGDVIESPLVLVNGTQASLTPELELKLGALLASRADTRSFTLGADARGRLILPLTVGAGRGDTTVRIRARAGSAEDDVTRTLHVEPNGFPIELSFGGKLEGNVVHTIRIPEKVETGSLVTQGLVYPSPLASLSQATAAMLAEPGG
ncbi:A-macroglobulin complement component, partial [bacterium]|nr:A-macroglobulin complement component [bacterium]